MSIGTFLPFLNQQGQGKTNQSIDLLNSTISNQINYVPKPFIFIQSNNNTQSSNVSDGVIIIQSPPMRHGERGVIQDLNINFTTVAGTVRICKINAQQIVLVDIIRGVNASTSGTGSIVLQEGEAIAIVGQAAGAGTFGVFFSGVIQKLGV